MKKITTLIILAFVIQTQAFSQSCLPNGINIKTQDQIDNFQTVYPNCTKIEGSVMISDQDTNNITNLNGLNVITTINGNLLIGDNNILASFSGLENLTFIGGIFEITDNVLLTDISALGNLSSIGGDLVVRSNNSLPNVQGLNNLVSVGGSLNFSTNDSLANLSGLNNLKFVGQSLFINNNPYLTSITDLEKVESIGKNLRITFNRKLATLTGLNSLTSIGEYLFILHNDSLINLHGLENVTSIGGELRIDNNVSLLSLEGIDNISAASIGDLDIYHNTSLLTCEVESICDYLANPLGYISISENATGCNNEQEIIDACSVGIHKNIKEEFIIYPNPTKNNFTISHETISSIDQLTIFNQLGKKVMTLHNCSGTIDVSRLEQGIYIIELTSNELKIREKLIIE